MAGAPISKVLLVFHHMGLVAYNVLHTFFYTPRHIPVPSYPTLLGDLQGSSDIGN